MRITSLSLPKGKLSQANALQTIAKHQECDTVIVSKEFADAFRPPPNDGRTYIIQDPRRPWLRHVSSPRGCYALDARDPKLSTTLYVNGKLEPSKYGAKAQPKTLENGARTSRNLSDKPEVRLINIRQVEQITGFGKSFIYENCGTSFPQRITLGSSKRSASRWVESEVVAWVNELANSRKSQSKVIKEAL